MNNVIEEIEILKQHTKEALEAIKSGELDKVKDELQKIIRLDIDELKRLHREHGPKRVVKECKEVFEDAKKALHLVDRSQYGNVVSKLIAKIYYLLEYEEREELNMENIEKQELREYFYSGALRIAGFAHNEIEPKLYNQSGYHELYAKIWEEAVRAVNNWMGLQSVISLGFDPHQQTPGKGTTGKPYIDPRTEPSYRDIRHAVAQKLRELDPSKAPYDTIRYIMNILHPGAFETKKRTYTERVRKGWGPFKITKEEQREYESKVLRPLEELIRELETS